MRKTSKKVNKHSKNQDRVGLFFLGLIVLMIVVGGIWLIAQSTAQPTASSEQGFVSLRDNWTAMETKAHLWKSDAYLFSVEYETPSDVKLTAKYQAPSVPNYELLISIKPDGELIVDPLKLDFDVAISKPIQLDNFIVDSPQAMQAFSQDKNISACLQPAYPKKQLSIESDLLGLPAWSLLVNDCPNKGNTKTSYLNAQNGKLIDPSTIK